MAKQEKKTRVDNKADGQVNNPRRVTPPTPARADNKLAGKVNYPLGKINFIMMGVCLLLIIIGFWLMAGSANVGDKFNNDLFEARRITYGPITAFLGFVLMAFAIIYRKKDNKPEDENTEEEKA